MAAQPRHWRAVPLAVVRSTGFPIDLLEGICVRPEEALVSAQADLEHAIAHARVALAVVSSGGWRQKAGRALDDERPLPPCADERGASAIAAYHAALAHRDELRAAAAPRFDAEVRRTREVLRVLFRRDDLREVLFVSSVTAAQMAERITARSVGERSTSAERGDEDRLTLFLQRVCAKNETTSFFGPVFWARLDGDGRFSLVAGPGSWIGRRHVYLEHWATLALARAAAADPRVAPYLTVRLNPSCRLEGDVLHYPIGKAARVDAATRDVIAQSDGTRTVADLSRQASDASRLAHLIAKRIVAAELLVPTVLDCDAVLRSQLVALPEAARPGAAPWIAGLDELRQQLDRYRDGPLADRVAARAAIEDRLQGWTGHLARRGAGQMFVGRNAVHEVAARNVDRLTLGPLVSEIERHLAPICELARWTLLAVISGYERRMAEVLGGRSADLLSALHQIRPVEATTDIELGVEAALRDAWLRVVGSGWGEESREVDVTIDQINGTVDALGPAPAAAAEEILGADFHSPDLLLDAPSADHLARGDYRVVLGELHAGVFAVASPMYLPSCPWPELLERAATRLSPDPLYQLVDSPLTYNYGDLLWPVLPMLHEVTSEGTAARSARSIPIADLCVIEESGRLYAMSRDGRVRVRLLSLYQSFVHRKLFRLPLLPRVGEMGARVVCGRFVLRRRTWRFSAAQRPPLDATAARTLAGHVALRRWQVRHDLPDRIFARVPTEPKPVFVDFRSPLLCATWLRQLRTATTFSCSEMLPGPDGTWLEDARGRCASELRLTLTAR